VPSVPGVSHRRAIRALEKAGSRVIREGKHVVMSDGVRFLTVPRRDPVNAYTTGGIVHAGLTVEEFRKLLWSAPPQRSTRLAPGALVSVR